MAKVTVVFPIYFDTKNLNFPIDRKRIKKGDEDYIEEIRDAIKDQAQHYLEQGGNDEAIITDSEIGELVE